MCCLSWNGRVAHDGGSSLQRHQRILGRNAHHDSSNGGGKHWRRGEKNRTQRETEGKVNRRINTALLPVTVLLSLCMLCASMIPLSQLSASLLRRVCCLLTAWLTEQQQGRQTRRETAASDSSDA